MSKINLLSSKIYNRIAAGEVIDRPASVIKELVENALDAKATSIEIEIEGGGIASVRVTDNGFGIEKPELKKAILPHATSKISKLSDLDNILSLGFRGEALASIASVSKLSIVSKPKNQEVGAKLYTEGGENVTVCDFPSADGTEITVNNLFFNTPARERFLKTDRSEEGEITNIVSKFILGNPSVAFKYVASGKTIYRSFGDGEESAFIAVYGVNSVKDCFYINTEKNGITIKGYIGKPYFSKPNRNFQTVFLNGRYIVNSTVSAAISNAYSAYLMKRQYPFYTLSVQMPTDAVDVNVHPNKTDVRFSNNQIVYGAIHFAVSRVLDGTSEALEIVSKNYSENNQLNTNDYNVNYVKHNDKINTYVKQEDAFKKIIFSDSGKKAETEFPFENIEDKNKTNATVNDIFAENKAYLERLERENAQKSVIDNNVNMPDISNFSAKQGEISVSRELKYIGQALNTFLILDDGVDIYFIDQHAAHERILFDKFTAQISKREVNSQIMLVPYIFNVSPIEADFINENVDVLKDMGIIIEEFGSFTFKVSSLPVIISGVNLKEFFDDLLFDLSNLKKIGLCDLLKEKIAQKACKAAIKSGDRLNEDDVKEILVIVKNNLGLKCPHGRPVAIKITRAEIDRWFKRIV